MCSTRLLIDGRLESDRRLCHDSVGSEVKIHIPKCLFQPWYYAVSDQWPPSYEAANDRSRKAVTSITKNTSYASPDDKPSMTCELRSLARTGNEPFLANVFEKASFLDDESTRTSAVTVAGGTLAEDGTATKWATPTPTGDK